MNYNEIYLTGVRLKNFQSWEDCSIQLTEGLNVIVAPNNTGKSVIFKAIKLAVTPNAFSTSDREDFLRNNSLMGEIVMSFSDNSAYLVKFTVKENGYFFINLNNNESVFLGSTPPEDLLNKLGIILRGNLIGNLVDMKQDLFLVDSDSSSDHSILSLLINDENLDKLKDEISEFKLPSVQSMGKSVVSKISGINAALNVNVYKNVEVMERDLIYAESLCLAMRPLLNLEFCIKTVQPFKSIEDSIVSKATAVTHLVNLYSNLDRIKRPKEDLGNLSSSTNLLNYMSELFNNMENYQKTRYFNLLEFLNASSNVEITLSKSSKSVSMNLSILEFLNKSSLLIESLDDYLKIEEKEEGIEILEEELNSKGGEIHDCPIHGQIMYLDEECIPYYK